MKIPELSSAFCGCTLETGAKIVAWFHLVCQGLAIVIILALTIFGSAVIKNEMDKNKSEFGGDDKDPTVAIAIGVGAVVIFFILAVILVYTTATIFLLLGVQKKRPGYMMFWLVLNVLYLIVSLGSLRWDGIISFAINLYFVWIVYSHYQELKNSQNSYMQHGTGAAKLQGDVPQNLTPNAPPAYSFNQKEY